jgi:hypothetical protein
VADQVCTTAQVKARLKITDATDDTLIGELIDEITDWLQFTTGRKLVAEAGATYVLDTAAGGVIPVKRGIRAVTSLGIATSDQPDTGGTYTAVDAADVLLRPVAIDRKPGWPATAILIRNVVGRLGATLNGARIVGDFGFATVPPTIQGVAIDAVVAAYRVRKAGASNVIGSEGTAVFPWSTYFAEGSPQRATVDRIAGIGIG